MIFIQGPRINNCRRTGHQILFEAAGDRMRRIDVVAVFAIVLMSGLILMISDETEADLIDESALATHDPILIVGNEEFTSENGIVEGSGTELDPYLIENWTFDQWDGRGISIEDASAHVVIRNCEMFNQKSTWPCIELKNSSNINIENCLFNRTDISIAIRSDCSNITIKDTLFNDSRRGIDVIGSDEITIRNNTFIRNYKSINFEVAVKDSSIKWNTFIGDVYEAVVIEDSMDLLIEENLFLKETDEFPFIPEDDYYYGIGVFLSDSSDCYIRNNNFSNLGAGLSTDSCERIFVEYNVFSGKPIDEYYEDTRIALQMGNNYNSRISGNIFRNCGYFISGEEKGHYLTNEISSTNLIDGEPTLYIKNISTFPVIEDNYGQIIIVNCSNMEISGLSMFTSGVAVVVAFCENITATYNGIENTQVGFYFIGGKNIDFGNNNFLRCGLCIGALNVENITIRDCNILTCFFGTALMANNSTVYDNSYTIVNQSVHISGNDNKVSFNHVSHCEYGINVAGSRNEIFTNSIRNCIETGITIDDDTMMGEFDEGKGFYQNNRVSNNTVRTCQKGMEIEGMGNFIFNNTIKNGTDGILIEGPENEIYSNRIFENNGSGIIIEYHGNEIRSNNISNNLFGIKITDEARDNIISENFIHKNEWYGIQLEMAFNNSIISNNISENHGYGIKIIDGCSQNKIHGNGFWYNNGIDIQAYDDGDNLWDDGFGSGNFWTDYRKIFGDRASHDGSVWNISYEIDGSANAEDRYPLVGNYQEPERELFINMDDVLDAYTGMEYSVKYTVYWHRIYYDNITWDLATNASWLSFNSSWYLTGTPGQNDAGSYWINLTVSGEGLTDFTNFTLTVHSEYVSPTIVGVDLTSINEDSNYITDYDHTGDGTPTWSLSTDCDFLSISSSNGVLSGTPDNDDVGNYWVNVSLFDGDNLSDFRNFTLTVVNVNDPPGEVEFDIGGFVFEEDSDQVITIDVTDPDSSHGDELNVTWTIEGIGVVGYGERLELDLDGGNYTLTVRVTDGNGSWVESSTSVLIEEYEIQDPEIKQRIMFISLMFLIIILVIVIITLIIFRRKDREESEDTIPDGGHIASRGPSPSRKDLDLEPSIDVFGGSIDRSIDDEMMEEPEFSEEPFEFEDLDLMELREQVLGSVEVGRISTDDMEDGLQGILDEGIISEEEYDLILAKMKPGAFQMEE